MKSEWFDIGGSDRSRYASLLEGFFPRSDVYFSAAYADLFQDGSGKCEAFYCEVGGKNFLVPFISRSVPGADFRDFETPYGYSGYLTDSDDPLLVGHAFALFREECKRRGVIAGLFRTNPFLKNFLAMGLEPWLKFSQEREVVVSSLRGRKVDEVFDQDFSSNTRNHIRKSEKAGLEIGFGEETSDLAWFAKTYRETMSRVGAQEFYFFEDRFFEKMGETLKGNYRVIWATLGEARVGGILLLHKGDTLNVFLSAATHEGLRLGVPSLLRFEAVKFGLERGFSEMNHGGGRTNALDDSLLSFKKGFSRNALPFYIGKMVCDSDGYERMCERWTKSASAETREKYGKYFLRYRY